MPDAEAFRRIEEMIEHSNEVAELKRNEIVNALDVLREDFKAERAERLDRDKWLFRSIAAGFIGALIAWLLNGGLAGGG